MSLLGFDKNAERKLLAWSKAHPIPGYDGAVWRSDRFGMVIRFSEHGSTTEYGWEIDHRFPLALGGLDFAPNLEALHWRNNRAKGAGLI